jgi:hypothetical protein
MARQTITFVLDTVRDRDILHWLEGQENKSAAIREAIRAHLGRSGITLADVYEAIQDLKRRRAGQPGPVTLGRLSGRGVITGI